MAVIQIGQNGNTSIYVGNTPQDRFEKNPTGKAGTNEKGSIFAGNLITGNLITGNQEEFDLIAQRKRQAQESAIKKITDVYANQQKIDQTENEIRESQKTMLETAEDAKSEIDSFMQRKQELMETYGVNPDSKEQKDLELLEKSMDPGQSLSEEEYQQLKGMGELTEYQKSALELDAYIAVSKNQREAALAGYETAQKGLIDINLEELKSHPMVDAQKQAAKIMQNAAKEAAFMLVQEAKDHIDEEMEEREEEVEKSQEEKEKEEEKLEERKNETKPGEVKTEEANTEASVSKPEQQAIAASGQNEEQERAVKEIKDLVKQQKLLEEDLLGIEVDSFI